MKSKVLKVLSLLSFLMVPMVVLAEDDGVFIPFIGAIMVEAFVTLHMSVFVLSPLSKIFKSNPVEQKKLFWKFFWTRVVVLLICNLIIPEVIIMVDFFGVFIGAFLVVPILGAIVRGRNKSMLNNVSSVVTNGTGVCPNCRAAVKPGNAFCTGCGKAIPADLVKAASSNATVLTLPSASEGKPLGASSIYGYNMTEDQMVEDIIKKEIAKTGDVGTSSIAAVEKKKNIFSIIYAIILFICVSLFFFHAYTAILIVVFAVVTLIYINSVKNYNITKYLQKEVKARPDEKIGYIVSSVMSGKIDNKSYKIMRVAMMIVAIAVPMFIFRAPHVIYEFDSENDGYVIRFYTIGWLKNDKELGIPAEYKNEPVVGIRGDVFANVKTLEKVVLPETIKEIRGGAFAYASNLEEINLPEGIPEIKGETFQGCESLKEITIPDSVTRIGGHAFRENYKLEKVNIGPNSQLTEIGSSAFRECYKLKEIYLPRGVSINERSFKDSPTDVKEYTSDGQVLVDNYKYDKYIYLQVGESEAINSYNDDAITQGYTIRLDKVEGEYGNYTFGITILKDGGGSRSFPLYREADYYVVPDYGIAVEAESDYIFDYYDDRVALNVYYN